MEHTLPGKPEVSIIADTLGISEDEAVGKLVRLWIWADQHCTDGHAVSVTQATLDRRASCPGLADVLRKVGWLEGRDAALSFPRFDRHNGQSAKSRAQARDRKDTQRSRDSHAPGVTKTGPEKRREEKKPSPEKIGSEEGLKFADWFKALLPSEVKLSDSWRNQWALVYDDMVRLDKRDKATIAKVCQWARADQFWRTAFFSPSKLRDRKDGLQYFDIFEAKLAPKAKQNPNEGYEEV